MRTPYIQHVKAMLQSKDAATVAAVKAANEGLVRCKSMVGSLHQDQVLTNISIAYGNHEFIGTRLMPVVSVPQISGSWYTYDKRNGLSGPDDALGARSKANEITNAVTLSTYACKGYGLVDFIAELDLQILDEPLGDLADLVQGVNAVMDLKEEQRIATIMTTAANFPGQTAALAGADRWDTTTSDPIADIETAIDAIWPGTGNTKKVAYMGVPVWRALQSHPAVLDRFKNVTGGTVSRAQFMSLFPEIDEFLVGRAKNDTANEAQSAVYADIWGKQFGIAAVATSPSRRSLAFGFTLRFKGARTTHQWFDPSLGTRGGYYVKVGVEEDHKIVASDSGYLYTTVVS
jgi:hypothetical protein